MIKSVTVTNHLGDSLTIKLGDSAETGFLIKNIDGLGPVKASINTTDIVTGDGSYFNSARVDERNIVFTFILNDASTIEEARLLAYKMFPVKRNINLLLETDIRNVKIEGYVESNSPDIFSKQETVQVSVICPDPFFRSTEDSLVTFDGIESLFEFPFSNEGEEDEIVLGEIEQTKLRSILYKGDEDTGIVFSLHALGEVSQIAIYNVETRQAIKIDTDLLMRLTGQKISAGDDIIINTNKGSKSVTLIRAGENYNIFNCINRDADWLTLSQGINTFAYTAKSGTENLLMEMDYYLRYGGI